MTVTASLAAPPLTLEQLAALSDEIAALARAGVPLDRGLKELGRELPGRVGRVAEQIAEQVAAGQPLERIVAGLGQTLPPAYRTVIAAGVRAGRLATALEGVAHTARRVSQLRLEVGLALTYPIILLAVAWTLTLLVLTQLAPITARMLSEFQVTQLPVGEYLDRLNATAWLWGPLVPLLVAVWLGLAWYRSGRVAVGLQLHPLLAGGAVGVLAKMQRAGCMSSLAELLLLLLNHGVPLAEAVELASAALGSEPLARGGKQLAEQLRRGERIERPPPGFSPLLVWTISASQSPQQLCGSLARTAQAYRDEFNRRGQWLSLYVPLFATIGVGGTLTAIYAVMTLGPWIAIMLKLAEPV